jgi:hypothetical protein
LIFHLLRKRLERRATAIKVLRILQILRRRHEQRLIFEKGIPVYVRKPRVIPDLLRAGAKFLAGVGAEALGGRHAEECVHEVFGFLGDFDLVVAWPGDLAREDVFEDVLGCVAVEGGVSE